MPSKKFDLEKTKAKKTLGRLAQSGIPQRFAGEAPPDRRERRRLDQAAGLVPFATKLPGELVATLTAAAQAEGTTPGELLARLLRESLSGARGYHRSPDTQEG